MKRFKLLALLGIPVFTVALAACGGDGDDSGASPTSPVDKAGSAASSTADPNVYARPELLVEPNQIEKLVADQKVAVVDLRKKESYDAGHIPGAVWYDPSKLKDPDDKLYVIRETLFADALGPLVSPTAAKSSPTTTATA